MSKIDIIRKIEEILADNNSAKFFDTIDVVYKPSSDLKGYYPYLVTGTKNDKPVMKEYGSIAGDKGWTWKLRDWSHDEDFMNRILKGGNGYRPLIVKDYISS